MRAGGTRGATREKTLAADEQGAPGIPQEILSVLAHELSSPVSVIRGFAEALLNDHGKLPESERRRFLEAIARGAEQVVALITTLTDVHGVETDSMDIHPVALDLGALVSLTAKDMSQVMPAHTLNVSTVDIVVPADITRIRQVLANLLTNARKFSPSGSTIDVSMRRDESWVDVCVRDHGPGIPDEKRAALFQKFSRLGTSRVVGMGLGLYISRGIMRAHGGDLIYEAPEGGGSAFVMRLPVG
jgi:signal transduction histidine kinase